MVKKKVVTVSKNPWFRKREGTLKKGWGFVPINIKGWVALGLLIIVNVFAANYFDIMNAPFEDVSKFLIVFLLSLAIFILFAKRRTKGVKVPKDGS